MPKAQETYNELLKALIAPGLREIGFKGSGQNYRLPSDDHWAMLGFQKSTSSDPTHVRFTANVLVVSRSSWDAVRAESPHLPERPTATTYLGDVRLAEADRRTVAGRRGHVVGRRGRCRSGGACGRDRVGVRDYVLPAMRRQMK